MRTRWALKEQARFLKRLGELLARGYPLSDAIESIALYLDLDKKQEIIGCLSELKEGHPLHRVLANLHFDRELINYVYFAEQHGGLSQAFIAGSNMMLKRDEDIRRIIKLVSYPGLLAVITSILFFFVDRVLLPKFSSLFISMQLEQNTFSKILYLIGDIFPVIFIATLVSCPLFLSYYFFIFRRSSPFVQRAKLVKIPVAGKLLRLLYTHSFSIQLSYLFAGGISVLDALNLFEKNEREPFSKQLGKEIKRKLLTGQDFETIVEGFSFFEEELAKIIKHGQENGKIGQELDFYSKYCLSQLEDRTERLLRTLQPLLYSFIGILVVMLYLAILLPMFRLMEGF